MSGFFCFVAMEIRAVILDLDGTLVDTSSEIALALDTTFSELGLASLPRGNVEALIGRGVRSLVERALIQVGAPAQDVDAAVERFEHHYARILGTQARLFPRALEGLRALHAAGIRMSVVTNKPRYFTQRLLQRLGVEAFFAGFVAGDDGIARKPHGDMLLAACRIMGVGIESALMIGDSDNDVRAARAAGCAIWCVPYGYNEGRGPETLACDRMVATLEEAAELITGKLDPGPSPQQRRPG